MRQILNFDCDSATCAATLDAADGTTGLLIVSGGNEIRAGSHNGMAQLAAEIAQAGYPVFRFDRRGVGDSEGINKGFEHSAPDIAAALSTFYARQPQLKRVVAFGNCDAATALLLNCPSGIYRLVISNPWLISPESDEPPPSVARVYYGQRMRDWHAWLRLLRGAINIGQLTRSLSSAATHQLISPLASRVAAAMVQKPIATEIILAVHDGTAIAFANQWQNPSFDKVRDAIELIKVYSASHSFAAARDHAALHDALLDTLKEK